MVELRKRKTPPPPPVARPSKKRAMEAKPAKKASNPKAKVGETVAAIKKTVEKVVGGETGTAPAGKKAADPVAAPQSDPAVGDMINLSTFGGEVETHEGEKVTLKQLVERSRSGVVLFTYPRASTPGCTVQACAFRDGYANLTSTGLEIYGLSSDQPKANEKFKSKQSLSYTLLCDPSYSLIGAIGMQNGTAHKTKRGVFAVDRSGKVLLAQTGGPLPTVDAVKKLVAVMEK
jgi:peroxiredoxin Q/BCP